MKKSIPIAALLGVTGVTGLSNVADANPIAATLISVASYSPNGTAAWNGTLDTSTWTFDVATGEAAMTGGTYSRLTNAGSTPLMRHTMVDAVLNSGAPTATSWKCFEGTFGGGGTNSGGVGASICGNYNFGSDLINTSTYTRTLTGATVSLSGDDAAIGAPQSLVTSYSSMIATAIGGAPGGFQNYCLSNGTPNCSSTSTTGYDFVFQIAAAAVPVPAAVWLFGSALGLMGAMRRRKSA